MTTYNRTTLKTFFETGDVPEGSDYANLIDSCLNLVDTAEQAMAGPLYTTQLNTPSVSALNGNFSGIVSTVGLRVTGNVSSNSTWDIGGLNVSGDITGSNLSITNTISANTGSFNGDVSVSGKITAGAISVAADVSAPTGTIYASALRMGGGGIFRTVTVVSAAGTTQATGAVLGTNGIARLKGIVNDTTTGFILNANCTGLQQTVYVEENTSCNLWPCVGGQINALASNAAFGMAGNATYIITHIKASGYSVK